ncbi:DUF1028 domain-containing protein [Chitinophagales bacterium]|nr:DUF1028 domain-containing protein [Chitinophagales bacterium]
MIDLRHSAAKIPHLASGRQPSNSYLQSVRTMLKFKQLIYRKMDNLKHLFLALLLLVPYQLSATFSIVAVDPETGQVGGAGATCLDDSDIAGGILIISAVHPGKGVIHTQSYWNPNNQDNANTLMLDVGASPEELLQLLTENDWDGTPEVRQYLVADFDEEGNPRAAGFTGEDCFDYKNQIVGPNYVIAGNILLNAEVLTNMEAAFLNTEGSLADKLMAALQGANIPGADSRCLDEGVSTRSAFIRVANSDDSDDYYLDQSVTLTPFGVEPIDVLQLQYDAWKFATECTDIVLGSTITDGGSYFVDENFSPQIMPIAIEYTYLQHGSDLGTSTLLTAENSVNEAQRNYLEQWMQQLLLPKNEESKIDLVNALGPWYFLYSHDDPDPTEFADWTAFDYCNPRMLPIYSNELQLPGSPAFQNMDAQGATQALSPLLYWLSHFAYPLAHPEIDSNWDIVAQQLIEDGLYTPSVSLINQGNRLFELATEVHWGFWENDPNGNGQAGNNELMIITRNGIDDINWQGAGPSDLLVNRFQLPLIIQSEFNGIFSLSVNESSYSKFTQYCDHAQLSGNNNSGLIGNAEKNNLIGNEGHNSFKGGPEFDILNGAEGMDTAIYSGPSSEYNIQQTEEGWTITDSQANRDDSDELIDIEFLRFTDELIPINDEFSGIQTNDNSFSIYPNPCGRSEFVKIESTELIELLSIYHTNGSLLFKEEGIMQSEWIGQLSHLEAGLYYVVLQSTSGTQQINKLLLQ